MPVLINFKICDNSKDCSGIEICPSGAFFWDEKKKTIAVDNARCLNCGKCEKACPVGAIRVARTAEEYQKIKKEIEEDPRKVSDLFIDRYGAEPVDQAFSIPQSKFEIQIIESTILAAVELFDDGSIMCLLKSIPVKELFKDLDIKYRKIKVESGKLLKRYKIQKLPVLLFFRKRKMIGKIEGYFNLEHKKDLIDAVNTVVAKIDRK